jgi:nucleoside-diphosphate-sugar epimerase
MRVFLTGATGFIGSFLVPELINADHHVVGLSRSDAGAEALTRAGAEVFRGDVNDLDRLRTTAEAADGVIAKGGHVMVMNPLPSVHVSDAVRLYRLALEKGQAGERSHAVGEEGVAPRDIAEVIGAGLKMPVESITPEEAPEYFGWLANLAVIDLAASSTLTRQQLGWNPTGPDLLTDLRNMDYITAWPSS